MNSALSAMPYNKIMSSNGEINYWKQINPVAHAIVAERLVRKIITGQVSFCIPYKKKIPNAKSFFANTNKSVLTKRSLKISDGS